MVELPKCAWRHNLSRYFGNFNGERLGILPLSIYSFFVCSFFNQAPFYGVKRMTAWLKRQGEVVNEKRVRRLLRTMGLMALYPGPKTSQGAPGHRIYPYLLREVSITRPDFVWSTDIMSIRLAHGFGYLVAIMDWFSRYVLAWRLSNSLETHFCLEALEEALQQNQPTIFNTEEARQFTSLEFTSRLEQQGVRISMGGRGRALDNVFVERLWRSVKWEEVYPHDYRTMQEAWRGLQRLLTATRNVHIKRWAT